MIGYNLLLDAPLDLPHLTALNPGALIINNGWERARDLKHALPNTLVIYRQWPDDNIHLRLSPQAWVDAHADDADEVLVAERSGQNRITLVDWLEGFIAHRDEP